MPQHVTLHTFTDTGYNNERKLSTAGDVLISKSIDPVEFVIRNERQEILHNTLKTLPRDEFNAIELRFFHHATSYRTIANKLHCSHEQVRKLIISGLGKLRFSLRHYFGKYEKPNNPPFTGIIPHDDNKRKPPTTTTANNKYPELSHLTKKEREKIYKQLSYLRHKERILKRHKDYYEENKHIFYFWGINWKRRNKEAFDRYQKAYQPQYQKKYQKRQREQLADSYVKSVIIGKSRLSPKDIPQKLVELKRQQLTLTRLIKKEK